MPNGVSLVKYSRAVSERTVLREPVLSAWRPIESCSNGELALAFATMLWTCTCGATAHVARTRAHAVMRAGAAPRRRARVNRPPSTVVITRTSTPPLEPVRAMAVTITAQHSHLSGRRLGYCAARSTSSEQMK